MTVNLTNTDKLEITKKEISSFGNGKSNLRIPYQRKLVIEILRGIMKKPRAEVEEILDSCEKIEIKGIKKLTFKNNKIQMEYKPGDVKIFK